MKKLHRKSVDRTRPSGDIKRLVLYFTFIFWFCFLALQVVYYFRYGKSMVGRGDGVNQHMLTLVYIGQYLRAFLQNIFVDHQFVIPMFDFSIGYGMDIISTLHYYGFGDPLNYLAVFVSPEDTESLYAFLCGLRMFIAGLSFMVFMSNKSKSKTALILGCLSYSFSAYVLMLGLKHPFFMVGMMYSPLVFLGIERILNQQSPVLFIVSLALAVGSNFYFAYMICIFMILYAALIYLPAHYKKGFVYFAKTVGKFALYTAVAMLIPMVIFLPQIINVLSLERLNAENYIGLFHSLSYYESFLGTFTYATNGGRDLFLGFGGVLLLCLFVAMVRPKENKTILIGFALCIIFLMFPIFGSIFNGFSYVSNRFCWIMVLIVNACFVVNYEALFEMRLVEIKKLLACIAIYAVLVVLSDRSMQVVTMVMIGVSLFAVGIFLMNITQNNKRKAKRAIAVLTLLCLAFQVNNIYSYKEQNYISENMNTGTTYKYIGSQSISSAVKAMNDTSEFYRYDNGTITNSNAEIFNDAMLSDMNSTSFFFSISNQYISNFIKDMGLLTTLEQIYNNTDDRFILQSLFGCKYLVDGNSIFQQHFGYAPTEYTAHSEFDPTLTDQYSEIGFARGVDTLPKMWEESSYMIYETDLFLPMGYTYDRILPADTYQSMNAAEKQNMLLQAAYVNTPVDLPELDAESAETQVTQSNITDCIISQSGLEIADNQIVVNEAEAALTIEVPMQANSEYYILWSGMDFSETSQYDVLDETLSQAPELEERLSGLSLLLKERYQKAETPAESVHVFMQSSQSFSQPNICYRTSADMYYSGYDNFLVNLGYLPSEEELDTNQLLQIEISFELPGLYSFDDLKVVFQPLTQVQEQIAQRKQDVLENVVVSDNTVSGTISLDTPKLLATQIPYSEGWRVFVDGDEAELVDVNTMFCGVMLDAGDHTVEFRYATPHWQLAVAMSAAGLVMLLVIALVWRKKHPKAAPAGIAAQPVAESASEESAVSDAAATATQGDAVAPDEIADTSATPDKTAGEALPPDEA